MLNMLSLLKTGRQITMTKYSIHQNNHKSQTTQKCSLKGAIDPRETAQYIADTVLELRNMAKGGNFTTLQGLLEVSFYEAFSAANRVEIPPGELDHLLELSQASIASAAG
jgi:hypothetical protein